ncbi:MAG: L-seryl-tRNA(Sec) selenium transferase [Acidobacteria bacterium]|nr:L-seryl-tRNA(Sec) selenium transferase [Acidobacteriota bacterium]
MVDLAELYRRIPRMDELLDHPRLEEWMAESGVSREFVREAATHVLDALRESISAEELGATDLEAFLGDPVEPVVRASEALLEPHLRRVVNATGVVIHTNLGRAPWSPRAAARVADLATGYTNLEFDLDGGERGGRERPVQRFLERLLPGHAVAVVNNNAAAILLALNTLAQEREVVVSRGELVEIGGSFRIPDVMEKGFCRLREVGTTNRTRIADYEAAVNADTGMILSVHPSNYRVVGFTESTPLEQLVELGAERDVPIVEDMGSGHLVATPGATDAEPTVAARLASGADLVTFSGDKLLGGPQAGFIVGNAELVERCRANPLYRAMRLDKSTLLALEATLADYVAGRLDAIPALAMLRADASTLQERAQRLGMQLSEALPEWMVEVTELESRVGGGAAPEVGLPSWGVAVTSPNHGPDEIARQLRRCEPAVVGRVAEGRLLLDVRTLLDGEDDLLTAAFLQVGP